MRRIILGIIFIISSLCLFAQRVNEHGLKIVSEIEILNKCGSGQRICYEYEKTGKLKGLAVYDIAENKSISLLASFRMQDNKIIRQHNGYLDSFNDCIFEVDSNRHIVRYVVTPTNPNEQDYGLRWEMTYQYGYDTKYNRWYLSSDRYKEYYYDNDDRRYILNHVGNNNNLQYYEGVVAVINNISEYYDLTHRNDTNISLSFILVPFNNFWDDYYFKMTEWIDCRNEFIPKNTSITKYEYVYQNGNLNKVELYDMGYLKKIIRINYQY